jgi:hypothetical protein
MLRTLTRTPVLLIEVIAYSGEVRKLGKRIALGHISGTIEES